MTTKKKKEEKGKEVQKRKTKKKKEHTSVPFETNKKQTKTNKRKKWMRTCLLLSVHLFLCVSFLWLNMVVWFYSPSFSVCFRWLFSRMVLLTRSAFIP